MSVLNQRFCTEPLNSYYFHKGSLSDGNKCKPSAVLADGVWSRGTHTQIYSMFSCSTHTRVRFEHDHQLSYVARERVSVRFKGGNVYFDAHFLETLHFTGKRSESDHFYSFPAIPHSHHFCVYLNWLTLGLSCVLKDKSRNVWLCKMVWSVLILRAFWVEREKSLEKTRHGG